MADAAPHRDESTSTSPTSLLRSFDPGLLGVALAIGTVLCALVVGFAAGVASALLVFVTGALLGAILLVWHSLRTLAGDADVDLAFDVAPTNSSTAALVEEKRRALRALKDIEQEHAIGKIDDRDFAALDAEYRERAKDVIREMDDELAPYRAKAEALVSAHLEKRAAARAAKKSDDSDKHVATNVCAACETANDADATFCKKCGAKLASDES